MLVAAGRECLLAKSARFERCLIFLFNQVLDLSVEVGDLTVQGVQSRLRVVLFSRHVTPGLINLGQCL